MNTLVTKYFRFCPKTGRFLGFGKKQGVSRILLPFIGLAAMIWILIRVIPKPSRIAYPCMRTAMPLASGFIGYLAMLGLSAAAFLRTKLSLRYFPIFFVGAFAIFGISGSYLLAPKTVQIADAVVVPNQPMGVAEGIFPGRVVWVHDFSAVNQNCVVNDPAHAWYMSENMNQSIVDKMVSAALDSLTGKSSDSEAWDAIFRYHNTTRGKGAVPYVAGQKIFIKINATSGWDGNYNPGDLTPKMYISETSVASVRAILRQLVNVVHVAQSDIYIGDPMKHIYKHLYDVWHGEFPNVHYLDNDSVGMGREQAVKSTTAKIYYSDHGTILRPNVWYPYSPGGSTPIYNDYLYQIFQDAEYIINIPMLKGHKRAGMTMFAKNHFGSHTRADASQLHNGLVAPMEMENGITRSGYGLYRVQVDIMEHSLLGKKNLLYFMDALWATDHEQDVPLKWYMPPFDTTYMSSVFVSLDPVAIESAGYDFLRSEFTTARGAGTYVQMDGVDDYLHQAADSLNWPAGIKYDPDSNGVHVKSIGVHEHWNDAIDKQYTRNLKTGNGMELLHIEQKLAYFAASPKTFEFDTVLTGASKSDTIVVKCTGYRPLIIDSVKSTAVDFTVTPGKDTIAVGDSVKFTVVFTPASNGPRSGSIVFYHDGVTLRDTVSVSGIGKTAVSVENFANAQPKEYQLFGNYPNPFNPSTTISYALPERSSVQIAIYDMQGRMVRSFAFGAQSAGIQRIVWNGANDQGGTLASGVYIYRVKASSLERSKSFDKSAKMILLK